MNKMLLSSETLENTQAKDQSMHTMQKVIALLMVDLGQVLSQLIKMLTSGQKFVDLHLYSKKNKKRLLKLMLQIPLSKQ